MEQHCASHLKIGLIDSGVGGFSILNSFLQRTLPVHRTNIEYCYIADSGHLPYGLKTEAYIHQRMMILTEYLLNLEIDALVIACNTATAVSIDLLRQQYPLLPIIGIEPAIKPATILTTTGHIAVAATQSTLNSMRLANLIARYGDHCTIHPIIGTQWVELVESGHYLNPCIADEILTDSLQVLWRYPVDQLILGCTHFPFLTESIVKHIPERVSLINPARSIVMQCDHQLMAFGKLPKVPQIMHHQMMTHNHKHSTPAHSTIALTLMTTGNVDTYQKQIEMLVAPHYHYLTITRIEC